MGAKMTFTPSTLYQALFHNFGEQNWWPVDQTYHDKQNSDPRFEIMVGAILTQNTSWKNVERALQKLKEKQVLSAEKLMTLPDEDLKILIQPSGFFNQKADRLKQMTLHIQKHYDNDFSKMFSQKLLTLRHELLNLSGIGPETADSILLYAGNYPIFVVDAYTKRICHRLPISVKHDSYDGIQHIFQTNLCNVHPPKQIVAIYQQFHALLVLLAKQYCKKKPACEGCPLKEKCDYS
jgi:endonuclease-3 related protein